MPYPRELNFPQCAKRTSQCLNDQSGWTANLPQQFGESMEKTRTILVRRYLIPRSRAAKAPLSTDFRAAASLVRQRSEPRSVLAPPEPGHAPRPAFAEPAHQDLRPRPPRSRRRGARRPAGHRRRTARRAPPAPRPSPSSRLHAPVPGRAGGRGGARGAGGAGRVRAGPIGDAGPGRPGGDPGGLWPPPRRPGREVFGEFRREGTGGPSRSFSVRERDVRLVRVPGDPGRPAHAMDIWALTGPRCPSRGYERGGSVTFATSPSRRGDVPGVPVTYPPRPGCPSRRVRTFPRHARRTANPPRVHARRRPHPGHVPPRIPPRARTLAVPP